VQGCKATAELLTSPFNHIIFFRFIAKFSAFSISFSFGLSLLIPPMTFNGPKLSNPRQSNSPTISKPLFINLYKKAGRNFIFQNSLF